jgi:hypothetical protein
MSRKKEQAPSLREKIRAYQRSLSGEAKKKFDEVFSQHTEASCFKEGLAHKNVQKAFTVAKEAIVGLPGSEPKEEDEDEDEE